MSPSDITKPQREEPLPDSLLTKIHDTIMASIDQNELTYRGLVTPYNDTNQGNTDTGIGLLPDSTKPLPESLLTRHQLDLWHSFQGYVYSNTQDSPGCLRN